MTSAHAPPMAPVFPLPNCVLFPKVILPLRIFEPRYKLMLQHVLDSSGWLAIGLYRGDRERDAAGLPDIFPVGGLGRLVDYEKADDGTFKIVLLGEKRVRWRDWIQVQPFPIATIDSVEPIEPGEKERDDIRGRLRSRIKEIVRQAVDSQVLMLLDQTIKECPEIGSLVDSIASHFVRDTFTKQRLLETVSAEEREKLLVEVLMKERFGERH